MHVYGNYQSYLQRIPASIELSRRTKSFSFGKNIGGHFKALIDRLFTLTYFDGCVYMGNNAYIYKRKDTVYNIIYIVSVKVQFFCFPIGQKRITCRFAKCRVYCSALAMRELAHNRTFIDRSTIEWVQCACASTVKFQSSFYYR